MKPNTATKNKPRRPGDPYPTRDHGDIVFASFVDGAPHSVVTTKGTYDFESTARGLMFHNAGGGLRLGGSICLAKWVEPKGKSFWAADGVKLTIWVGGAKGRERGATPGQMHRAGKRLRNMPSDPFRCADEAESGFSYCTICDQTFDESNLCKHLFWADYRVTGPGDAEAGRNGAGDDCKESFQALVRRCRIARTLRRGLDPFTIKLDVYGPMIGSASAILTVGGRRLFDLNDRLRDEDEFEAGANWLWSLDEKTVDANAKTIRWLDEMISA
ncbi:MAG: hypothetical protein ACHREM_01005 [Polyangiales bacterium]